ncbi:MAG: Integral membrane protein, partial [uncultured Nocardioides sp.]
DPHAPGPPDPAGAAPRTAPSPPPGPADARPAPVRRLDGHDDRGHARPRPLGRPARRPGGADGVELRDDRDRRRLRRPAAVDPAAPDARPGHGGQRGGHRCRHRRHAGAGRPSRRPGRPPGDAARRRRGQRLRRGPLHRLPARPRPPGRADDGPGAPHGPLRAARAHLAGGAGARRRLAARRTRRAGHGGLCARDRSAGAHDAAVVHRRPRSGVRPGAGGRPRRRAADRQL